MKHVSTIAYIQHLRRAQTAPPVKRTWLKRLVALLAFSSAANALPIPNCAPNDWVCIHKVVGYERPTVMALYGDAKGEM